MKRIFYKTWVLFVGITVFCAITLSILRLITPIAAKSSGLLYYVSNKIIDYPVDVSNIQAQWYRFGPVIRVNDLKIYNKDNSQIMFQAKHADIGFSLWTWLKNRAFFPNTINIERGEITFKENQSREWVLLGLAEILNQRERQSFSKVVKFSQLVNRVTLKNFSLNLERYGATTIASTFSLTYLRDFKHHNIDLHGLVGKQDESQYKISLDFHGDLDDLQNTKGKGYVFFKSYSLTDLLAGFDYRFVKVLSGRMESEVWLEWQSDFMGSIQSTYKLDNLFLFNSLSKSTLENINASGHVYFYQDDVDFRNFYGKDIKFWYEDDKVSPGQFKILSTTSEDGGVGYQLESEFLRSDVLFELGALFQLMPRNIAEPILKMEISSNLTDLSAKFKYKDQKIVEYETSLKFSDLTANKWNKIPQFSSINGQLYATNSMGTLSIDSNNLTIEHNDFITSAFDFSKANSNISWKFLDDGWELYAKDISLNRLNEQIFGSFSLIKKSNEPIFLELIAAVADVDINHALSYLSARKNLSKLEQWIERSVSDGVINDAMILLRTPLEKLDKKSFDEHKSRLEINANISSANLNYHPRWPVLKDIDAQISLEDGVFEANILSANIYNAKVNNAKSLIHNVWAKDDKTVHIEGNVSSDSTNAVSFINHSPLQHSLGKSLSFLIAKGILDIDLSITQPIKMKTKPDVKGKVKFDELYVNFPSWDIALNNVNGSLEFINNTIFAKNISAQAFTGELNIDIDTISSDEQRNYVFFATGTAHTSKLASKFPNSLWQFSNGSSNFMINLNFFNGSTKPFMQINSALEDINISLPEPIGKTKGQVRNFSMRVDWPRTNITRYKVNYDNILQSMMEVNSENFVKHERSVWVLDSEQNIELPSSKGLEISGNLTDFDFSNWMQILAKLFADTNNSKPFIQPEELKDINIYIKNMHLLGLDAKNALVTLTRLQDKWRFNIDGTHLTGNIEYWYGQKDKPINVLFERCKYDIDKIGTISKSSINPQSIPSIAFRCHHSYYQDSDIGDLYFKLNPTIDKLQLIDFKLKNKLQNLQLQGSWDYSDQQHKTSLSGIWETKNFGKALKDFNFNTDLEGGTGKMDFDLNWLQPPTNIQAKDLTGAILFNLNNGRIVDIKTGVGRVFSLFSLDTLQRRLRLDFSDLFKQGLSFDYLKGEFDIHHGVAYTTNTKLASPSSDIQIAGQSSLVDKTINFDVNIMPHFTGNLPMAAAIATANPVVGVVAWALNKVVTPQIQRLTGFRYIITGTWDNQEIVPIGTKSIN